MHLHKQRGLSITELLIAVLIGAILMAGVISIFLSSRVTFATNERMSRLQENGRVALDLITHDIRAAGYNGCARGVKFTNALNNTNPLLWNYVFPMQGFESVGAGTYSPALTAGTLTPAPIAASDVIALRVAQRDGRSTRLVANLAAFTDALTVENNGAIQQNMIYMINDCQEATVFQATGWDNGSPNGTLTHTAGAGSPGNSTAELARVYAANSVIVPLETIIYWVANDPVTNEPGLYRRIGLNAAERLIDGVQALQVSYGEDTVNGDRIVDLYRGANTVVNWNSIISVNVALLIRSEEYGAAQDAKTYQVLPGAAGGQLLGAFNDRRQRLMFSTSVALRNRAL
jgi:type IV pilus assembly protein PilW